MFTNVFQPNNRVEKRIERTKIEDGWNECFISFPKGWQGASKFCSIFGLISNFVGQTTVLPNSKGNLSGEHEVKQ